MPVGNRQPVEAVNEGTGFVVALKVVHLTSVHHPYDNRIFHKECATLAAAGYQVTLVAPCAACDVIEGTVRVRALKPPPNRLVRALRTIPQVYWAALREDAALYHFHDPELMPVGALLRINGRKVIYDVHEDYAGSMAGKQWIPGLSRGIASWGVRICEHFFASRCSKVIAATPTIARLFPGLNVGLVQNFPWRDELAVADAPPYALRHPIVAHVGALGGVGALAWVAIKVGALSYGGGFVIVPLMEHDVVTNYHWMSGAQFLNAVALGQLTPGPVVLTVAVVGYAVRGIAGALLASAIAFAPSFLFILGGASHFESLRTNPKAAAFLRGAGPCVIGSIAGSAILLGSLLGHLWQIPFVLASLAWLFLVRRGSVSTLLLAGGAGALTVLALGHP